MSNDTKVLTPAQSHALWKIVGSPLLTFFLKMVGVVVAVFIAIGGVMYIRDKTSGMPEDSAQTAHAQPLILKELKELNDSMDVVKVDIAVLKNQMAEVVKWKDRQGDK